MKESVKLFCLLHISGPEKFHTHPRQGHWGSGVLKTKILEAKYEAKLEFPRRGVQNKKIFRWGIFFGTAQCAN